MNDRTIDVEQVRREHLAVVHAGAHWAYLVGVIALGTVAMLLLIAALGAR